MNAVGSAEQQFWNFKHSFDLLLQEQMRLNDLVSTLYRENKTLYRENKTLQNHINAEEGELEVNTQPDDEVVHLRRLLEIKERDYASLWDLKEALEKENSELHERNMKSDVKRQRTDSPPSSP